MITSHDRRPRPLLPCLGLCAVLGMPGLLRAADHDAPGTGVSAVLPVAPARGLPPVALADPGWPEVDPDREGIRLLVKLDPSALGPLSIGTPDAGLLFNPQPMPEGPLWTIRNPAETFGTTETIGFIAEAVEAVDEEFPGSPRIVIGDISRRDGGRLNRHASHQVGRDVDLGFYYTTGETDRFFRPRRGQLDLPRTWALIRAIITRTDVNRIFLDRSIQRPLYAYAVEIGEDQAWLDDVFGRYTGGKNAIIQHVRRHTDHMHVRFYNRRAQEWGRVAYPLLVGAGLVPGPTVTHRVRNGETLSFLSQRYGTSASAIRRANGLRGSLIRAGHRYVIPVRRIPNESGPVVIPPRRLPGAALVAPGAEHETDVGPADDGESAAAPAGGS
jgi:murein endopeptidase